MAEPEPIQQNRPPRMFTALLMTAPPSVVALWAAVAAFSTYFSMYAFRKPFLALAWDGDIMFGLTPKAMLAISQIMGYTVAKYIGTRWVSEITPSQRAAALLGLIGVAQLTLILFAWLPEPARPLAMFANGVPLGMVWGLVVMYLEGRRSSEILFACLATSYILASGVVKDAGLALMRLADLSPSWMPAATGLAFLPAFVAAVWALEQLPPPGEADRAARTERGPMDGPQRRQFVAMFSGGLALQVILYFFITAFRDFRDVYGVEILTALGYAQTPGIFTKSEIGAAIISVAALASLNLFCK